MDSQPAQLSAASDGSSAPKTPTGPKGHFLLGSALDLARDPIRFSVNVGSRYGAVSVFRMGPLKIYMVNHPDGIKRVLQENNHNYTKESPVFNHLRGLLGNGLFLSEGEFWLRQRRLMQPMFHRQRIASFGEIMTGAARETLEGWRVAAAQGRELDIAQEMMRLALDVACRSLFSIDIRGEASTIGQSVNSFLEDFIYRFDHPFYPPVNVPTPRNLRYHRVMADLNRIVYGIIAKRRRETDRKDADRQESDLQEADRQKTGQKNDLLSLLLEVRDEQTNEGMTDKQIRDELMTLLLAGHETTAVTLTWAVYLLSTHPEVEQRVFTEVQEAAGGRELTVSDLSKLPYTQRVIDETMRLYPPVYVTNRMAKEEDVICGYRIPKGASVSVSPFFQHHMPEHWENPEAFDPDRFLPERSQGRPQYAYFPFGGGPRLCIGKGFALVEAPLVLATIVQQCRLYLKAGHEVRMKPQGTLRPEGGMPMTIHFRQ